MQRPYVPAAKSVTLSTPLSPPTLPPTAHSATLPYLPTELIVEIYTAADTFATAETLSKTSHRLQNIWKVHADTILTSVVECFPQAQELALVQEDNFPRLRPFSLPQQTMTTAHRICMNVNLASSVFYSFENQVIKKSAQRGARREGLTQTERADFIRSCYRAMTLAAEDKWGIPHSILDPLDMLEYMQMKKAIELLNFWLNDIETRRNNIHEIENFIDRTSYALQRLWFFYIDLMRLHPDRGNLNLWESLPFDSYYTLGADYQKKAGSALVARGARLAELLPLLPAQNGRWV